MILTSHRSHDYALLLKRWHQLAADTDLKISRLAMTEDIPVFCLTTRAEKADARETIYLSAGVHGDEPAAPWGLLEWAEEHLKSFSSHRLLIFPCFNPHGLINNIRLDQRGEDINRIFNKSRKPLIAAWRKALQGHRVCLSMCLHEDYDAQGCYVYELTNRRVPMGSRILRDCSGMIPTDQRKNIDGRRLKNGVYLRRVAPDMPGVPEAIALHHLGVPISLTFETPSEFSLLDRVAAQKIFIQSALNHVSGI